MLNQLVSRILGMMIWLSPLAAHTQLIVNGGFEDLSSCPNVQPTQVSWRAFDGCLGPQWHNYWGTCDVWENGHIFQGNPLQAHGGNRFAHLFYKTRNDGGPWVLEAEAFYINVNLEAGKVYTMSYFYRLIGSAKLDNFYIIATNGLTPFNINLPQPYLIPDLSSLPPYQVVHQKILMNPASAWSQQTFTFQPNQNYTQLLFTARQNLSTTTKFGDLFLDDISLTTPSRVAFDLPQETCGCPVVMNASATENLNTNNYFLEIFESAPNYLDGYFSQWYSGKPGQINLCDLYNFSCNHSLGFRTYRVKLAINDPVNGWMEMVKYITVKCAPQVNILPVNPPILYTGHTLTLTAVPYDPQYTYLWYRTPVSPANYLGSGPSLVVGPSQPGKYSYTVVVSDNCNGCTASATRTIKVTDPIVELQREDSLNLPLAENQVLPLYLSSGPRSDSPVKPLTLPATAMYDALQRQVIIFAPLSDGLIVNIRSGKKTWIQMPLSTLVQLHYIPVPAELKGPVTVELLRKNKPLFSLPLDLK